VDPVWKRTEILLVGLLISSPSSVAETPELEAYSNLASTWRQYSTVVWSTNVGIREEKGRFTRQPDGVVWGVDRVDGEWVALPRRATEGCWRWIRAFSANF